MTNVQYTKNNEVVTETFETIEAAQAAVKNIKRRKGVANVEIMEVIETAAVVEAEAILEAAFDGGVEAEEAFLTEEDEVVNTRFFIFANIASQLNVRYQQVWQRMQAGKLEAVKVAKGKRMVWAGKESDIETWAAERKVYFDRRNARLVATTSEGQEVYTTDEE